MTYKDPTDNNHALDKNQGIDLLNQMKRNIEENIKNNDKEDFDINSLTGKLLFESIYIFLYNIIYFIHYKY